MSVPDTAYFDPARDSLFVGGLIPADTLLDTLKALPSTDTNEAIYVLGLLVVMAVVVWIARKPRTAKDGES